MPNAFSIARAGRWFLESGIQEESGGVARFYDAVAGRNRAISTEITGYVASALIYLHRTTGEQIYLDRAAKTARFLMDHAWDQPLQTFPFEHPSPSSESEHHSYFFDTGIIIRGLLAVWRCTKEDRLLEISSKASHGMVRDFQSGEDFHPILTLPHKEPVDRDDRWSRSAGCYQLKAALAWWEVAQITGDTQLRDAFLQMLESALQTHTEFLPGVPEEHRVMDRLHAYSYFLEGLSVVADREDCRAAYRVGLGLVSGYLRAIAPTFVRVDVCSQLLRARIYGATLGMSPMDAQAAEEEAAILTQFQMHDDDKRIDGAFVFGRRDGALSMQVNPWASAFALQALDLWEKFQISQGNDGEGTEGSYAPCPELLI